VACAVVEVDLCHVVDVDRCRPQIQDNVVRIAARTDVVAKHFGGRTKWMQTQILDGFASGAVEST
jgi:hypothetical protein